MTIQVLLKISWATIIFSRRILLNGAVKERMGHVVIYLKINKSCSAIVMQMPRGRGNIAHTRS
jgi:hypothetical protein